jgi:hypothetical protein
MTLICQVGISSKRLATRGLKSQTVLEESQTVLEESQTVLEESQTVLEEIQRKFRLSERVSYEECDCECDRSVRFYVLVVVG